MKVLARKEYGNENVLTIEERQKPDIKENEVLIKVHATSINYADYAILSGSPGLIKLTEGLTKPKHEVIGMDYSGVVEAVGKNVSKYKIGDHVFGELSNDGMGAYSEYCAVPEDRVTPKSILINHEVAAAMPLAGVTALQGIRDHGNIKKGSKVLINGASSGVGSFAVQIAKDYGAHVTILCHPDKIEALKTCRPDEIIDYTKTPVEALNGKFDLIYDCAVYQPPKRFKHLLDDQGTYIANGGAMKHFFKILAFGKLMSKKNGKQYKTYLAKYIPDDLKYLNKLVEENRIKPLIYKVYKLDEYKDAFKTYKSRSSYGKITITMG